MTTGPLQVLVFIQCDILPSLTAVFFSFHSKKAIFDNKKAIRGGIPIVFRKFSNNTNFVYINMML